jgi:hypothetical protein
MPHISTLDEASRATLERILSTDIRSLTPEDMVFLRARREYLNGEQLHNLASVLKDGDAAEQEDSASEQPAEAPKRGRSRKTEDA